MTTYAEPESISPGSASSSTRYNQVVTAIIAIKELLDGLLDTPPVAITKRQGGSDTDCSTPGTNEYTVTSAIEQIGVVEVSIGSGASSGTSVSVTFPDTFDGVPHVMISPEYVSGNDLNIFWHTYNIAAAGFTLNLKRDTEMSAALVMNFHWRAVYTS